MSRQTKNRKYSQVEVENILNSAISRYENIVVNKSQSVRDRLSAVISGTYDNADTLHNIYADYGYPATLTFDHFWNMYRRFGIAKQVIELYPDAGWSEDPLIFGSSKLVKDLDTLNYTQDLWHRMKTLDENQRVGRYAGVFIRVRDGRLPEEPIQKKLNGVNALVDLIPLYESQLKVITIDNDPVSDTYGMPTMYQFNGSALGDTNEHTQISFNIHPSRVIISAENSGNKSIYGKSSLESVYNSLMDLRKIIGAGGEGFYINAAQSILLDVKDSASAFELGDSLDEFSANYDDFIRNRARRAMWTPGMEAKTLDSNLVMPKEFFMNALSDVAAGAKIPATMLIGQQTGKLASIEDVRFLMSNVNSRRNYHQTKIVRSFIDWMMKYGILPAGDYEVKWPDALALSSNEKLDSGIKMASINTSQFNAGQGAVFSSEEIRLISGYESEPDEVISEELPDNDEED